MIKKSIFNIHPHYISLKNNLCKIFIITMLSINNIIFISFAEELPKNEVETMKSDILYLNSLDENEELKSKFQPIIENIFLNRNTAILAKDSEGLKEFYDLNKKVGLWAYENEAKKIQYFSKNYQKTKS